MARISGVDRLDHRRVRADRLLASIMQAIDPWIDYERRSDVYYALRDILYREGVEVLTDYDREMAGLPARGPDGWTIEEIIAWDRRLLMQLMQPPMPMFVETKTSSAKRIANEPPNS